MQDLTARETFLAWIVADAVEASNMTRWAKIDEYHYWFPDDPTSSAEPSPHGGANAWATFVVPPDFETVYDLTPRVIAQAFNLLLADDYPANVPAGSHAGILPGRAWRREMLAARRENESDAVTFEDASWLVQLGVFGAVVFLVNRDGLGEVLTPASIRPVSVPMSDPPGSPCDGPLAV